MKKREFLESKGYALIWGKTYEQYRAIGKLILGLRIDLETNKFYLMCTAQIETQKDIDNLQIAFNNVKRDYEEMQKLED